MPRTSVKGQVLANLVTEFAKSPLEKVVETQSIDGNQLAQSLCKNFYSGMYMLMV